MYKNIVIIILCLTAAGLSVFLFQEKSPLENPERHYLGKVQDFALLDQDGRFHRLRYHSNAKAIVLMSYGIGCPIARLSLSALKKLRDQYQKKDVVVWLIDAYPQDSRQSLVEEAEAFDINMPILMDESQMISKSLGIERTGEAILIDPPTWKIVYRGMIDDRLGYEFQRGKAQNQYLSNALKNHFRDKDPFVLQTEVKGCLIPYEKGQEDIAYSADVVPILERKCMSCHHGRGVAPWAMDSRSTLVKWAPMMQEVIRTRRMPPVKDADEFYRDTTHRYSLTPGEIRTLLSWLREGAPQNEENDDPLPPIEKRFREREWPLGSPDLVLTARKTQDIAPFGVEEWARENFVTEAIPRDLWAKAVYIKPSDWEVIHHGNVWAPITSEFQTQSVITEVTKGYEFLAPLLPGVKPTVFPAGTGKFLPEGAILKLYTHYDTIGRKAEERPQVGIYLYEDQSRPIKPLIHHYMQNDDFRVPANARSHEMRLSRRFHRDILLYGVTPHMHYRGKSARFSLKYPDGSEEIILSLPEFDYDWSRVYFFEDPIPVSAGTTVRMDVVFDNSEQNSKNPDPGKEAVSRFRKSDEMLWGLLVYTYGNK